MTDTLLRCQWAGNDPLMIAYHDEEWGVPCHDDQALFERLMLEGFQAGLSWSTILRKRKNFRLAFDNWDPERVAAYDGQDIARLLADAGIIRHRGKIKAAISNARAFMAVQQEYGSFDRYVWAFVDGVPFVRVAAPPDLSAIPAQTPESTALSKDLKRRGFRFVGPTICYAFMQSAGLVNDHTADCFRAER